VLTWGALIVILAYLVLKVLKPLFVTLMTPRPGESIAPGGTAGGGAAAYGEMAEAEGAAGPSPFEEKLDRARGLASQDPKAVANIIKDWTGSNAG
jgi:flagellar biosynthesis/type III secretory pathway M-ring protein FliF/YscJ